MTNEIKEILNRIKNLKHKCNYCLKIGENMYIPRHDKQTDNLIEAICLINDMEDCITNLQEELNYYITHCEEQRQELHRLNNLPKENKRLQKRNIELVLERDRARGENKVLIDKVIEYIKENKGIDDYNKWVIEDDDNYLLNILEGDDKSE